MSRQLKYPIYLFMAMLIAKIVYVVVESFYNNYVLEITTSATLSKDTVEQLNTTGHTISAIGVTLLLIPFFYLLVKKYSEKIIYLSIAIASIITFILTYNILNTAIDSIVESNKDKRHNAYYINFFKYGMLNNLFTYNSFIDNQKIQDDNLDANDRLLLVNSFLLLHADKDLIEKLKKRGKEVTAEVYISKHDDGKYAKSFEQYKKATKEIQKSWSKFNDARKELYTKIEKNEDRSKIKQAHKDLISQVKTKYNKYKNAIKTTNQKIEDETEFGKVLGYQKQLKKYFKYQKYSKAKKQYREKVKSGFGYFVEPYRWLDKNNEVTVTSIRKVIREEILSIAKKKMNGLPNGLDAKGFFNHFIVKTQVAEKLKEKGIAIPEDFDYSYNQFKKYYQIAITKETNKAPKIFYKKLEDEIGQNDLKLDFTWEDFIQSKYIKDQIKTKLNTNNNQDVENMVKALKSKDLANFKKLVYLPKVIEKIEERRYKEVDFLDGGKAEKDGDDAIKLLYIPPFALAISIIALLLNMVTVIGLLLEYSNKVSKKTILGIKVAIFTAIIMLPIVSSYNGFNNELISQAATDNVKIYLEFLNWISFYEIFNTNLHN